MSLDDRVGMLLSSLSVCADYCLKLCACVYVIVERAFLSNAVPAASNSSSSSLIFTAFIVAKDDPFLPQSQRTDYPVPASGVHGNTYPRETVRR